MTFDLLNLKVVSESCDVGYTSVLILVFLGLSVLDLGPMYATDSQTSDVRRASSLNASTMWWAGGGGIKNDNSNMLKWKSFKCILVIVRMRDDQ